MLRQVVESTAFVGRAGLRCGLCSVVGTLLLLIGIGGHSGWSDGFRWRRVLSSAVPNA